MVRRSVLISFILLLAVIIYNCDDAGQVPEVPTYTLGGSIENWTLGVRKLRAVVTDSAGANTFIADSTTIATNGDFTLNMKSPPDNFFYQYTIPSDTTCVNGVSVSPTGLKNALVAFKVYDTLGTYVGKIERKNYTGFPVAGSFWVNYFHFNTNGSVLGDITCISLVDTVKTSFNLVCTYNWKPVVAYANTFTPTYRYVQFSHTEPTGGIPGAWKFSP